MNELWYCQPACEWEEALPLGNGRLGAMVFGNTDVERIQVNEESIWYGGRVDRNNPDLKNTLPQIRSLLSEGRIQEAEKLLLLSGSGCPHSMHPYQTLGEIILDYHCVGEIRHYRRSLDLETASAKVVYEQEGVTYERHCFISRPAGCLIMRLIASQAGKIQLTARLDRSHFFDGVRKRGTDGISLHGNLGRGGAEYASLLRAKVKGGEMRLIGESLVIENADEAILVFTADSTYHFTEEQKETYLRNYMADQALWDMSGLEGTSGLERQEYLYQQGMQALVGEKLDERTSRCLAMEYETLLQEHLADYQPIFNRVELQLGTQQDALPTNERLAHAAGDIGLMKQLFDFGRYLLISSSREGDLPATLQGIWNKDYTPPWESKYTININLEMNYWHAETCNLSECHTTLLPLLQKMRINGRKTAREMYGCRGFLCHHNTDIHGDTAPQDHWIPGTYWVMGAAWLCTHLWTHYQYTLDKDFLREAFPVMAEAALFFVDFLIERDGYLVTSPSVSPENTYILPSGQRGSCCEGPTMDDQILRHFFTCCIEAGEVLGEDIEKCEVEGIESMNSFLEQLISIRERLRPTQIGKQGTILEWSKEFEEAEPGHRHISHLYGLYPSDEITMDETPELAQAARRTLEKRLQNGGGHTGWSRAWIMNHYAKLWDGEEAYKNLGKMLESSTYPNLFDKHPPFQIDGNFGAAAAIAQMLVQSNSKRVVLLPALPKRWDCGFVRGLRLVGNAEISLSWRGGKLESCIIHADSDYETLVKYGDKAVPLYLKKGESSDLQQLTM